MQGLSVVGLARMNWMVGLAIAVAAFSSQAASHRIQVQAPAILDPAAPIMDVVKAECGVERLLSEYAFEKIRESVVGVRQAADADHAATDPYLKLTIIYVYGAGGGSWSGPKSMGIRADLLLDTQVIATEEFRESSIGGMAGPFSGTCAIMERITKALGEQLADWLPTVTEITPVPKRVARRTTTTVRKSHTESVPSSTRYAAINDFNLLPLRDEGKNRYQHYLTLPSPKAFAISENGLWRFYANESDAMTKALDACVQSARTPCWLYAVDDRVVWSPDLSQRFGKLVPNDLAQSEVKPEVKRVALTEPAASAVSPEASDPATKAPAAHRLPMPAASGFASGDDADALPLKPAGKALYRRYLNATSPKAFVIYADGGSRFQSNNSEAMTLGLDLCARQGKPCWLYAVDDRVVWRAEIDKRISASAQLRPR